MFNKSVGPQSKLSKTRSKNHVSTFARTVQKSESWIKEMHSELEWMDADAVYHLLRAVLQALRDQMNINEAAQFATQLPLLLRGTFYECWDPHLIAPKALKKEEFFAAVRSKMEPVSRPNFDFEQGIQVALKAIMSHVGPGEMHDVISSLNPSLRTVFEVAQNKDIPKQI